MKEPQGRRMEGMGMGKQQPRDGAGGCWLEGWG